MERSQNMICIVCPKGCHLTVSQDISGNWLVEGNACKRGEVYGIKEMTNPTRVLTSTVKIIGGPLKRLPVKTKEAIPKELLFEAMEEINKITVTAPVQVGDVLIKNLLNTGVDLVASRSMKKEI